MKTRFKHLSKSTISIILAVMMVVSTFTVGIVATNAALAGDTVGAVPSVLYLKPNNNWFADGVSTFKANFNTNGSNYSLVEMSDEGNGYYSVSVPSGATHVEFCRGEWQNNITNQSMPTDGKNCFTINEGTWNGSSSNGTWSTYISSWTVVGAKSTDGSFDDSHWADSFLGTTWNVTNSSNDMSLSSGVYTKTYTNVPVGSYAIKVVGNHSWDVASYPENNKTFTTNAVGTVTVTFNPSDNSVSVTYPGQEDDLASTAKYYLHYANGSDKRSSISVALPLYQVGDTNKYRSKTKVTGINGYLTGWLNEDSSSTTSTTNGYGLSSATCEGSGLSNAQTNNNFDGAAGCKVSVSTTSIQFIVEVDNTSGLAVKFIAEADNKVATYGIV